MPIKYKTNLKKVKINDLKRKIFELLSECDMSGNDGNGRFYVYHGVRVTKYADEYSVKTYEELTPGKERLIEVNNLFILKLLMDSIPNEIEVITS